MPNAFTASDLRLLPVGCDSDGLAYWYRFIFCLFYSVKMESFYHVSKTYDKRIGVLFREARDNKNQVSVLFCLLLFYMLLNIPYEYFFKLFMWLGQIDLCELPRLSKARLVLL